MNGENLAPNTADTPVTFHSLFIADLHLSLQAPGTARIFLNFLNGRARQAKHLYILGDLFNAWLAMTVWTIPNSPLAGSSSTPCTN